MKIQRFHNCSPWVKSEGEKPRAKPQTNILPSCVHKNHKKYCSGGPKAIGTAKNTRNGLQDVQAEVLTKSYLRLEQTKVWRRKIEYFSLLSYDFWSQSSRGVYVKFAEKS